MSTDPSQQALSGPVMGTHWSALVQVPPAWNPTARRTEMTAELAAALAASVAKVDRQMSTWKPDSDLMRLNAAAPGRWLDLPPELATVLAKGLEIGRVSNGAFDIGLGDLVAAWGFGAAAADPEEIRKLLGQSRPPAHQLLELDRARGRARKHGPLRLDLSGIAKGYGVDQLLAATARFGVTSALVGLDGELRASGPQADGAPWCVAIEEPDHHRRAPLSLLTLENLAVATSGDYRHWVMVNQHRLAHTMDRRRGGPLNNAVASVTVLAETCMTADAWATALLVMGPTLGPATARALQLSALFVLRREHGLVQIPVGRFATAPQQERATIGRSDPPAPAAPTADR